MRVLEFVQVKVLQPGDLELCPLAEAVPAYLLTGRSVVLLAVHRVYVSVLLVGQAGNMSRPLPCTGK